MLSWHNQGRTILLHGEEENFARLDSVGFITVTHLEQFLCACQFAGERSADLQIIISMFALYCIDYGALYLSVSTLLIAAQRILSYRYMQLPFIIFFCLSNLEYCSSKGCELMLAFPASSWMHYMDFFFNFQKEIQTWLDCNK